MHVLFQRANSNPSIMRDRASDYKEVVCMPTIITAALGKSGPLTNLSTINADGSPQVNAIWIGFDGDNLISTHTRFNAQLRNMQSDPRLVLSFAPAQRPVTG
jgi:hypothetical protein